MKIFKFFTRLHVLYEIKIITYSNKNYYICNPKSDLFKIDIFKNKTLSTTFKTHTNNLKLELSMYNYLQLINKTMTAFMIFEYLNQFPFVEQ